MQFKYAQHANNSAYSGLYTLEAVDVVSDSYCKVEAVDDVVLVFAVLVLVLVVLVLVLTVEFAGHDEA